MLRDASRSRQSGAPSQSPPSPGGRSHPLALPVVRGQRITLPAKHPGIDADQLVARRWLKTVKRPRVVDLFSGAGGLSLGLKEAGFDIIAAADHDKAALETHAANIGGLTWSESLADPEPFLSFLSERGIKSVDVVAGGPPCQPFSRAGAAKIRSLVSDGVRNATDNRVELWRSFVAVVERLSPEIVLLENVPDMAGWDEGGLLLDIMQALAELGFESEPRVLEAHNYGVPQHRARLFVVGTRSRAFNWPKRRPRVSVRDAIGDLPKVGPNQREDKLAYHGAKTKFQQRARQKMSLADRDFIYDHCTRDVREDDAKAYALMKEGGTYRDLPPELQRYRSDIFDDKYKRLTWNDVSRTITAHIAKDAYWYIHPREDRTLSIREAARLQTFPDWFRFAGHPTTQLRQIGNAVPPALSHALGLRLKAALDSDASARKPRFARHLVAWDRDRESWHHELPDPKLAWPLLVAAVCFGLKIRWQSDVRLRRLLVIAADPSSTLRNREVVREELETGPPARADKLLALAQCLTDDFGGVVPANYADLRSLPHVSDHIATVVRSFAFDGRCVVLGAGSRRIAKRVAGVSDFNSWNARLTLYRMAESDGPTPNFNRAIRDLAEEICLPSEPRCHLCPLVDECQTGITRTARRARNLNGDQPLVASA